jgi:hypothetical protein
VFSIDFAEKLGYHINAKSYIRASSSSINLQSWTCIFVELNILKTDKMEKLLGWDVFETLSLLSLIPCNAQLLQVPCITIDVCCSAPETSG